MTESVKSVLEAYPVAARRAHRRIRQLVYAEADELGIDIDETLKWGEPSYLTRGGSTLRVAWKPANPDQCSIFVHCQTRLIETFREIYPDTFVYEGKRAIHLPLDQDIPEGPLRQMIRMTLTYHKVKHLPLLGA